MIKILLDSDTLTHLTFDNKNLFKKKIIPLGRFKGWRYSQYLVLTRLYFSFLSPLSRKTRKPKLVATIRHLYRYLSCRAKGEIRTPLRKKNIYLVYQSALLWKGINKKNRLGAKIFFKENCIQLKGQSHFILAVSLKKFFLMHCFSSLFIQ